MIGMDLYYYGVADIRIAGKLKGNRASVKRYAVLCSTYTVVFRPLGTTQGMLETCSTIGRG